MSHNGNATPEPHGNTTHWRPGMTGEIQTAPLHGAMAAATTL